MHFHVAKEFQFYHDRTARHNVELIYKDKPFFRIAKKTTCKSSVLIVVANVNIG